MKQVFLVTAAALTLSACTAQQPAAPGSLMPGMASPAPASPSTVENSTSNAVSIKDFAFAPSTTTVKAGTTVTWTNQDQDPHTVTSTGSGGPLRSPTLQQGQSYRYTFNTPGHYDYLCTIHPFMTATVTVTP